MKSFATFLASTLVFGFLTEGAVRFFALDVAILQPVLYWVEGDFGYIGPDKEIYQSSENPERLYELIPNAETICSSCTHAKEEYSDIILRINSYGFRGEEFQAEKPKGVFRIFILGGSNIFGPQVTEGDTFPAKLERALNKTQWGSFDKVEVINAGLNANVISQKVAYAFDIIDLYDPDLFIVQNSNWGRRAFFYKEKDFARYFKRNHELFFENFPFSFEDEKNREKWHMRGVEFSAIYRAFAAVFARPLWLQLQKCRDIKYESCTYIEEKLMANAEVLNQRAWERLVNEQEAPVIFFDPKKEDRDECENVWAGSPGEFVLCGERPGEEYENIHPPSYVYDWYVEKMVPYLKQVIGG